MTVRKIFYVEAGLAAAFAASFLLALIAPDWIERVFDAAPDNGNGEAEWGIAVLFGLAAVVCAALARMEWRRARLGGSEAGCG